jgi:hypothetical protein
MTELLQSNKEILVDFYQSRLSILKNHKSDNNSYGNDAGSWRENPHDDLVLAVALAAWYGEHYKPVVDDSPPSLSFRGSRYSGWG